MLKFIADDNREDEKPKRLGFIAWRNIFDEPKKNERVCQRKNLDSPRFFPAARERVFPGASQTVSEGNEPNLFKFYVFFTNKFFELSNEIIRSFNFEWHF